MGKGHETLPTCTTIFGYKVSFWSDKNGLGLDSGDIKDLFEYTMKT